MLRVPLLSMGIFHNMGIYRRRHSMQFLSLLDSCAGERAIQQVTWRAWEWWTDASCLGGL